MFNAVSRAFHWSAGRRTAGAGPGRDGSSDRDPADIQMAIGSLLATLVRPMEPLEAERVAHLIILFAIICVGTVLRFWGLGNVGLHGDEETMAMATMEILRSGSPILPSGMFYPRGLTQLYLMAGSVAVFGESEWAFRFPSALCGVVLIGLAYLAGRRYLQPRWNLAFAACIALLPELIIYSQTARMYIFLLAAIAAAMACVHAWERTGHIRWLVCAMVALIVGIELHTLAVTVVLIFMVPGLVRGDVRMLMHGIGAAVIVMLAFVGIDQWVGAQYPIPPADYAADLGPPPWNRSRSAPGFDLVFDIALSVVGFVIAMLAIHLGRIIRPRQAGMAAVALLLCALLFQLILHYHIAGLFMIAAVIVARRFGGPRVWRRLSMFGIGSAALALVHVSLLIATPGSVLRMFGVLVGEPSVWPYVKIAYFSYVAAAVAIAGLIWGLSRLAVGERVADHWVLGLLGVWVPMFMIGFFLWDVPSRYTVASLLPLLICAFAVAQETVSRLAATLQLRPATVALLAAGATLLTVNPVALARATNAGYEMHPDHKGAAEFIKAQQLGPDDIVLAEDVLQQTYYLGRVDYWLMSRAYARRYVMLVDGEIRDFYTATPVVSSAAMLESLLKEHTRGRIFVIGSGENQADRRRSMRGDMADVLYSDRFSVVYEGRDHLTKVWLAAPAARGGQE